MPLEVLEQAKNEMTNYAGTGTSVMEMSHRSPAFEGIIQEAERDLRDLLSIPSNYKILFLQGGASSQFSMVPLNLMTKNNKADYIVTGAFAKKAFAEGKKFGDCLDVASSADKNFTYIPNLSDIKLRKNADYVHITSNNTIYGTRYAQFPDTGSVPLVADMSSEILSRNIDVSKFGLIYAGAQKNVGPAGVCVVIVREDLIDEPQKNTPAMFTYKLHSDNDSMYNTPPCYPIYICGLVFKWLKSIGGVDAIEKINIQKANLLYDYIENSKLFTSPVVPEARSIMNVTFVTGDKDLDAKFVAEAKAQGLINLKGHRSVGGMRASIYNAMPVDGVKALVAFMQKFEKENI
jgi:phosphoserine aminotransferase